MLSLHSPAMADNEGGSFLPWADGSPSDTSRGRVWETPLIISCQGSALLPHRAWDSYPSPRDTGQLSNTGERDPTHPPGLVGPRGWGSSPPPQTPASQPQETLVPPWAAPAGTNHISSWYTKSAKITLQMSWKLDCSWDHRPKQYARASVPDNRVTPTRYKM